MSSSLMIVLIGVSGAGKSTLRNFVCQSKNINVQNLIAVTNRQPRANEIDKVDKYFLSINEFAKQKFENRLCLINEVYGNYYGFYKEKFNTGFNYLCELYYKNYQEFLIYHPKSISIYIKPQNINFSIAGIDSRGSFLLENKIRKSKIIEESFDLEQLLLHGHFNYEFINNYNEESKEQFAILINKVIKEDHR